MTFTSARLRRFHPALTIRAGRRRLADELGLKISVCRFPTGTSKWNRIERRIVSGLWWIRSGFCRRNRVCLGIRRHVEKRDGFERRGLCAGVCGRCGQAKLCAKRRRWTN